MKYCVSGRQNKSFFSEVDEIKMQYRDKDRLINYLKEFPDKTFILHIPKDADDVDWHLFMTYAEEFNFMVCLDNLHMAEECLHHNIPFYWSYPVF